MKKSVCILLAMAMLLGMLGACGGGEAAAESTAATTQASAENTADLSAAPSAEESPAAETAEEAEASATPIELPLTDTVTTVTYWTSLDPRIIDYLPKENVEDALLAYTQIQKTTGVKIHLVTVSPFTQSEQFNLMIAGGDYCDIIYNVAGMYTTGSSGAMEDGVIMDLADLLKEYAPDVYALFTEEPELKISLFDEEGRIGSVPIIYKETGLEAAGMVYRADWAKEFGLDSITTTEQYHDYLLKAKETYGAYAYTSCAAQGTGYSTVDGFACQSLGAVNGFYQLDGKIHYGPVEDAYYNYVDLMHQWCVEGLFDEGMLTNDMSAQQKGFGVGTFSSTLVNGAAGISELYAYGADASGNPTIEVGVLGRYKAEGVDQWVVSSKNTLIKDNPWSLSVDCSQPELICKLINWLFTEDGSRTATYGVEGETYTLDENGNPQYTDMILNNPDGYNTTITINMYATANVPGYFDQRRTFFNFDETQLAAVDVFKGEDVDRNNIPAGASNFLSAEEQSQLANYRTEYETVLEEMELSFIMGKTELNQTNWKTYIDDMYNAGLQDAIDLTQTAYDRYEERLNS